MSDDAELFEPIATGRVSKQIVERLGDAIRDGSLSPGDRLPPERVLAERFGVSRVTVRDALRALEVLGLIEVRVGAGGGPVVRAPGAEVVSESLRNLLMTSTVDPADIAEARLLLDIGTVALVAARGTDEDLDELEALTAEARAHLEAGTHTTAMAGRWHIRLAEASHNPAVVLVVTAVRSTLSMSAVRRRGPSERDAHLRTIDEHEMIVAALRERDGARAQGLMAMHLLRDRRSPEEVRATLTALLGASSDALSSVLSAVDP